MSRNPLQRAADAIRQFATMLMGVQERSQNLCSLVDPRDLSEHMQRDLGLVDGRVLHDEHRRMLPAHHESSRCWADFVQTRSAV